MVYLLIAVLAGFGMAVALVEKKKQFPIRKYNTILRRLIGKVAGLKWRGMMLCTVCLSFWTTLVAELYLMCYSNFTYIPMWPISGFITLGFTWSVISLMNAIDPPAETVDLPEKP